ncbi:MAG: sigma-54 dependent transcriptional regulator [Verrucomicrobiota bacterium]|jgi:NtrC-family two-component system response regulator AlgB
MEFLVIDDDRTFRDAACLLIEEEGHYAQPAGCGRAALANLKEEDFDAVLLDVNLGSENGLDLLPQLLRGQANLPVVMLTAQGSVDTAVEAMRRGAVDFLEKPFTREQFHRVLARMQRFNQMSRSIERLEREVSESKSQSPELLLDFESGPMREVMAVVEKAARTAASVLLLGESGTGKSILARVIHQKSHLADKPLVTVSCPSLSRELLESELFGHVKGAFTGAVRDHWGKVKAAHGGTLFLDEIGDLPMEIQPKLLRLLQEREYERLGENVTRQADLRVIAASNRDLKKLVAQGQFREDLYFRLNVIVVEAPPLRNRVGDMERFARHYLRHFAGQCGRDVRGFSADSLDRIRGYAWPGNLRELRNAIERAVILTHGEAEIEAEDLPFEGQNASGAGPLPPQPGELVTLEKLEDAHIRKVLERTGSVAEAARVLGIDQATIYRKRKKMGVEPIRELQMA